MRTDDHTLPAFEASGSGGSGCFTIDATDAATSTDAAHLLQAKVVYNNVGGYVDFIAFAQAKNLLR
ncbi:MAG: hypothetical protein ACREJD_02210 [Phycisphaerales bacterium]